MKELSLRRVPPNLLVGQGATDFAFEQGMAVLPNDALVSPVARERYRKWKRDLREAEKVGRDRDHAPTQIQVPTEPPPEYEESVRNNIREEEQHSVRNGVWNEGQPNSPGSSASKRFKVDDDISSSSRASSLSSYVVQDSPPSSAESFEDTYHVSGNPSKKPTRGTQRHSDSAATVTAASPRMTDGPGRRINIKDTAMNQDQALPGMQSYASSSDQGEVDDGEVDFGHEMLLDDDDWGRNNPGLFADAGRDNWETSNADGYSSDQSNSTLKLPSLSPDAELRGSSSQTSGLDQSESRTKVNSI